MDLDRRQFLKLGMAASASVAASGAFGALGYALSGRHVSRTTSSYHAWTDTACRMCETGCGIRAFHDKYGNLVTLAGIPDHPVNQGKICAKGMAAINLHYHPERLLTPLFADKGRGKGFDSITYEDALKKAADMIRQAKAQNALFVVDTQDEDPEVYATLFRMLGVDYKILSRPILKRRKRQIVDNDVYGSPNINPAFSKSGAILAVGANPFEGGPAHLPLVRQIAKARVAYNSQLIVLDPCNTNTAGKADLWLPILPGTDALAMIQLLRICNQFSDNKPDLPRGITQQDVFRITGLTQDQFAKAADLLMSKDFLTILASDWIYSQPHAKATRYWLKQLASIKDKNSEQHFYKYHRGDKDPDCLAVYEGSVDEHYKNWFTQDRPVLLITRKSNPIYGGQADTLLPSLKKDKKVLAHISICPFGNETNQLADLIFPETIPLEDWGLVPIDNNDFGEAYTFQKPIPNVPSGLRSGYDVMMDIAEQIGMLGVAQTLGRTHKKRIDKIKETLLKPGDENFSGIPGITGNLYPPSPEATIFEKPVNPKPEEADEEKETKLGFDPYHLPLPEPDGIQILTHDTNVMNDDLANAKWLAEISHQNALVINPTDAKKNGIRQGDEVRIETDGKMMVASADLREGIRPGVVSLAKGFGHDHYGKVAKGERWRTDDPDMWLIWWGQYGNGVNANLITSGRPVKVKLVKV